MNVLSLFDGMSCGRIALQRVGIKVDNYFSSEIDKYALKVANKNWPQDEINRLGDVRDVKASDLPKIDLLIGGSPCQSFSFAGKRKGMSTKDSVEILSLEQYLKLKEEGFEFEGQSYLFWEYMRLLRELQPKYFLLENVKMSKKWKDVLSEAIGVEPILINSALVSAQNRERLYWTNIPNVEQPEDKGITIKDIVDLTNIGDDSCFTATFLKEHIDFSSNGNQINKSVKYQWQGVYTKKMKTLNVGDGARNYIYLPEIDVRKLTPEEAEKCQTVPVGYTNIATLTNRYKMLGNGWTVDVIAHIFKNIE